MSKENYFRATCLFLFFYFVYFIGSISNGLKDEDLDNNNQNSFGRIFISDLLRDSLSYFQWYQRTP